MKKIRPWYEAFRSDVTSQFGEDGIIAQILSRLPETDHHCVEFGAWDGKLYSNVFRLIDEENYSAVLIEADPDKFKVLQANFASNSKITPLNKFVGFENSDSLDAILSPLDFPINFDLLAIDIDGNDYHVWNAINVYRPKVVVIEYNPTIPNGVDFVQAKDPNVTQGASLDSLVQLGKEKRYELVAVTTTNGIFVESSLFANLGIADNSVNSLRVDMPAVTYLFCGYDGTVILRGSKVMPWHQLVYNEEKMQHVPLELRAYPHSYNAKQIRAALRVGMPEAVLGGNYHGANRSFIDRMKEWLRL